ncbi:unnamed protein product, partial [Rotaria socialis]
MLRRQLLVLLLFVLFTANLAQKYVPNDRNDNDENDDEDQVQPVNRVQPPSNNNLKPASSINANVPPASDPLAPRRYIDSNRRPSSSLPTPLAASKECESDVQKYCGKGSKQLLSNLKVLQCVDDLDNAVNLINKDCQHRIYQFKYNMTHDPRFDDAA